MTLEEMFGKIPTLKEKYTKLIADSVTICIEDLSDTEKAIIEKTFELFQEKMDDLKIANDEVKRLTIELANLRAMLDDTSNDYDNNED